MVSLAGYQDDVAAYYSIANTFVLPSHSEGCPNVLLEAMAAGLPVIATLVGGVPEFVNDHEDALLVHARQPEALARSIVRVLESEPLRERLAAAAVDVVRRHRPADYLRKLTGCFEQALDLEGATARRVARDL
jgi:glycosyltransferase involved in cell wall biosynthesis